MCLTNTDSKIDEITTMAKFEKGNKIGRQFTSTNQPSKRGRGKCTLSRYIEEMTGGKAGDLSQEDVLKTMKSLCLKSPAALEPLIKDSAGKPNKETPTIILNLLSAYNKDIQHGRTTTLEMILDRLFGKATQNVEGEITTNGVQQNLSVLTDEELKVYVALQEKVQKGAPEAPKEKGEP